MKLSPILVLFYASLLVILGYWVFGHVKCTFDTFAAGPAQLCIGDTCLNENDAKRLKGIPNNVETKSITMNTWKLGPEANDTAFVVRDVSTAGQDNRYAFWRNKKVNI